MLKLINARFKDVCLECGSQINPGDLVFWSTKQAYHKRCYLDKQQDGVVNRWLRK